MPDSINNERFRKLLLTLPSKAVELLYNNHYNSLVNISKKFTRDKDASVDIVQEVLIHVWERYQLLSQHHDQSIEHYLVRVVKNRSITYFKASVRLEDSLKKLNGSSINDCERSAESRIIEQEVFEEIRHIITTFPKREKECLQMKIEDDMTTSQIAAKLNISGKAVERSLTSANKRLRKYWSERR